MEMPLPSFAKLEARLASVLPESTSVLINHISTTLEPCSALYSAPPGCDPTLTTWKTHFLAISVLIDKAPVHIFALEVLIYHSETLSTLFVSKADSTGYSILPKASPSLFQQFAGTFMQYLVELYQVPNRQFMIALFARAQNQYLFPASVENSGKHILDDRGLIKWWCKTLDTLSHQCPHATKLEAFLRIPGLDRHETAKFIPRSPSAVWKSHDDPLRSLQQTTSSLPERCLIPRFPDDPKSRFVDFLDEELPLEVVHDSVPILTRLPETHNGKWSSIKTWETFWDAMSYRQECSAGRLVGFIWALIPPNTSRGGTIPFDDAPVIFSNTQYERLTRVLLDLDYGTVEKAKSSTARWIVSINDIAGTATPDNIISQCTTITGTRDPTISAQDAAPRICETTIASLNPNLVRKKKRPNRPGAERPVLSALEPQTSPVSKKVKVVELKTLVRGQYRC